MKDVDTQRCLIMQKTGTATWDLTSLRRPREGVSPPSLQHQDRRTCSFRNQVNAVRDERDIYASVADPDPGSGIGCFLTSGSGIRNRFFPDPGSRIPDPKTIFLRAF